MSVLSDHEPIAHRISSRYSQYQASYLYVSSLNSLAGRPVNQYGFYWPLCLRLRNDGTGQWPISAWPRWPDIFKANEASGLISRRL